MIKVEIKLKTNDKTEVPSIMAEIARKIGEGYTGSNHEKYWFNVK